MPDTILSVTLFGASGGAQLAGPAMIKTQPTHTIERVAGCFCRWAEVPPEMVKLQFNGQLLHLQATVQESGMGSGSAVLVQLAADAPRPSAASAAAPFAMLDVEDSELASLSSGLGM